MTAPVADQRILRGVAATLSWQNLDGDGEPTAPGGAVTVGVVNSAGATVLPAGTSTGGAGAEPRTVALTAAQNATLDRLTATWTDAGDGSAHTTDIDVVGGFYFTVAEARDADPVLADGQKYPDGSVVALRRDVEEEFERICDLAFVPRFRVDRVRGSGCEVVLTQPEIRAVRSVTTFSGDTPTAWTQDELDALEFGQGVTLHSRAGKSFGCGEAVVAYEHGFDRPPAEVKRVALQRLRYLITQPRTGLPDRATSFTVVEGGGTYRLDTAGAWKVGTPDIDAVLQRYSRRVPGIA